MQGKQLLYKKRKHWHSEVICKEFHVQQ